MFTLCVPLSGGVAYTGGGVTADYITPTCTHVRRNGVLSSAVSCGCELVYVLPIFHATHLHVTVLIATVSEIVGYGHRD